MNKNHYLLIASMLTTSMLSTVSYANVSDQIGAVAAAEAQGKLEKERLAEEARAAQEAQKATQDKAAQIKAQQAKVAADRKYQESIADKKRNQAYEDELRRLELEEKKLELERKKARVKREDEYIDQEIKRQAAHTDVIQSDAEVNRSIARGTKQYLSKEGEAAVTKAATERTNEDTESFWSSFSRWFD